MKPFSKGLLFILLGLILAIRLWVIGQAPAAFGFDPGDVHPDQGVVVLMAKHIMQGGEFPLMHYGQAYLGTLEAFLLAIPYLLFGVNLWVVHLVPVVCFLVFCFALFLLARTLFSTPVGLWALLWCAFAPLPLTEYSIMPQLGNITAPMFGTIILYLAVFSLKSVAPLPKRLGYGLLGLLAGIGWWTSPMLIYYLFTVPLFMILKEKWGELLKGGLGGLVLFFIGALPFFSYYGWEPQIKIFSMGEGYSLKSLKEGLRLFFLERIHYFLDLDKLAGLHQIFFWLGAVVYISAVLFFIWNFRHDWARLVKPNRWGKIAPGFLLVLFFIIFVATIASSVHIERNATRYFFPLATFFPLALGFWVVYSSPRWRFLPMVLFFSLLGLQGGTGWKFIRVQAPQAEAATQKVLGLTQALDQRNIQQVYSWQWPGSEMINFYSRETVLSARPMGERYRPYEDRLEAAARAAFLDPGDKAIPPTLKIIGGSCRQEKLDAYDLYTAFRPPSVLYQEIPREEITVSASDQPGQLPGLMDRRQDTEWSSVRGKSPDMWIKIDLGSVRSLGMIRLYNQGSRHAQYAYNLELKTSLDGLHWETVFPETNTDLYYWDGPRLYYWELNYRWECRFGPLPARYLKITNKEQTNRFPWSIGELYVFEDRGRDGLDRGDVNPALERIRQLGLKRIYAGRWLSARIREATEGQVETVRSFTDATFTRWPLSRVVVFGPKTGFVVDRQDQAGFEALLHQAGIRPTCESLGPWCLYYFKEWDREKTRLGNNRDFWWAGFGVLRVGPSVWNEYHRRGLDIWP
jgi:4-amino-4-deoxy-L-arabinose transferase-like glycosyltransferase